MADDPEPAAPLDPRTLAAQALGRIDAATGAVVPPVHLSSTFCRDADYQTRAQDAHYGRYGTPTISHAEELIAALEGGTEALVFASGMAACTAAMHALEQGDHIVCADPVYFGVVNWLERFAAPRGLAYDRFANGDTAGLARAIRPGETRLVWLESPANPDWSVTDIAAASAIAHEAGAMLAVDSTCATPVLTRPLEHGADIVCHSATKYLGGHSDLLAGALVTGTHSPLWERIHAHRTYGGAILGGFDAFLLVRGIRTLFLRVERQSANALAIARFLAAHPKISHVCYPGLPDDPGHAVACRQMQGGFGGMLSFQAGANAQEAIAIVQRCRILKQATSLGGVESLIEHRRTSEGAVETTTPENLIRLSAGIECADDLIADLDRALGAG